MKLKSASASIRSMAFASDNGFWSGAVFPIPIEYYKLYRAYTTAQMA